MWLIVIAGGIVLWHLVPQDRLFASGMIGIFALALGLCNWVFIMYKAGSVHRKAPASVDNINKLVKEGIYAQVRHPIYLADIILACCVFVFYPDFRILAAAVWLIIVLVFWAKFEERMLEEKFLDDYREYKKRVPMLIPRFRKYPR